MSADTPLTPPLPFNRNPVRAIEQAISALREILQRHPEVRRDFDCPAFIAHELEPALEAAAELERRSGADTGPLKLDNDRQVFFYEQDHYYLSNFSAFRVRYDGIDFDTSEHVYHWCKFANRRDIQDRIRVASSAHEAFKIAEAEREHRRGDWDRVKVAFMRDILRAKVRQHEYVSRKLLQTGNRELIENSWRDDFWGWGENRDGQNMLGKLWMEIRAELLTASPPAQDSAFSNFIRNASPEEKERVYQGVMERAAERQKAVEAGVEEPQRWNKADHHASCHPTDSSLVWQCGQCGHVAAADDVDAHIAGLTARLRDEQSENEVLREQNFAMNKTIAELTARLREMEEYGRHAYDQGFRDGISAGQRDREALLGFVQGFADEPCVYGDNCPPFVKLNHGQCLNCKARAALSAREGGK
jgi:ribA/ribD-fused uncharacterized protein